MNKFNMIKPTRISTEWGIILALSVFKLSIHLLTSYNYDHHFDGYLYAALADKLDWGYISVPPSIAIFTKMAFLLFGKTSFALSFFPASAGATFVLIVGASVKEMGGNKASIFIACFAFIISPSFLRSNTFLQPTSFDQFYWLMASYLIIRLIKTHNTRFWVFLGIVFALAFINKYSITFFALAFFIALLLSNKRKLLLSKHLIYGLIIGFIIILPNLIWQADHNWPVFFHMKELQQTQLVHVKISEFLIMQLLMNLPALGIWFFGLIYLLFLKKGAEFRIIGWMYVIIIIEMLLFKGKFYYNIGIYSILFVAGAVAIKVYWNKEYTLAKWGVISFMVISGLFFLPYSLPILNENAMVEFCKYSKKFGIVEPMRWNNGEIHQIPQDFAEMIGANQLSEIVINTFNELDRAEQNDCFIYCDTYSLAGIIKFHGEKYGLPEPICYQDNFILWNPENMDKKVMIYINYHQGEYLSFFDVKYKTGEITNPNSILNGVEVFLCKNPSNDFREYYHKITLKMKNNFR